MSIDSYNSFISFHTWPEFIEGFGVILKLVLFLWFGGWNLSDFHVKRYSIEHMLFVYKYEIKKKYIMLHHRYVIGKEIWNNCIHLVFYQSSFVATWGQNRNRNNTTVPFYNGLFYAWNTF